MTEERLSTCVLCEAMCGIRVTVSDGRAVAVRGDPDDPFSQGHICPKAPALIDLQYDPDRLRTPLKRTSSGLEPVGWDEALGEIAARIHAIQGEHGRNAIGAYAGNPNVHNLGSMMFLPMFLRALRTRNKFSATSLDQLPHMLAAAEMFGHELLLPVPDLDRADFLVVIGGNPLVSNGSIMTTGGVRRRLKGIKERGEVVVIDPRRSETAQFANAWHPIRPGTDAIFLLGLLRALLDLGPPRLLHLTDHVDGVDAIVNVAEGVDLAEVEHRTGIGADTVRSIAKRLHDTPRACVYGRLGACAQRTGGLTGWLLVVVNAVAGHLDTPGGLMVASPAFDVLYPPGSGPRRARPRFDRFRSRVRGLPEFAGELPSSVIAEEIDTPGEGQIRGMIVWAGNPVLSSPDGQRLRKALARLDLLVSVDLYVNETAEHADYVLPTVPPLSRDHYDLAFHALAVRNTSKFSKAVLPSEPGPREDWRIAVDLADRLQRARGARITDRARWAGLRRLGPAGLLALGLRKGPVSLRQLRREPHGVDLGPLQSCLLERSPLDRLQLAPPRFLEHAATVWDEEAPEGLLLIGRRELRSNNSWLHNSPRLTKAVDCSLYLHPDDAASRGITEGVQVVARSRVGEVTVPVTITDEVMPGVVSLPHGWGHTSGSWRRAREQPGASVNDLTDGQRVDPLSGNAVLNGVPVEIEAASESA